MGYANGIRVMSMTHTGEPGFMLYIPIEVRGPRLPVSGQGYQVPKILYTAGVGVVCPSSPE